MMRLYRVRVENYRGIRLADLELDELTVVIGENGCGKSSLLNALETCLGRKASEGTFGFQPSDVYTEEETAKRSDLVRIHLHFVEETPSSKTLLAPFREAGFLDSSGRLDFQLQVQATPENGDFEVKWRLGFKGQWLQRPDLLALLREACPVIRIRCGRLPGFLPDDDEIGQSLLTRVRGAFRSVMESKAPPPGLLELAIGHLEEFITRFERKVEPPKVDEIRGRLEAPMKGSADLPWLARHLRGSGIQSLALLAVVSVFIEAHGPGPLHSQASPIITLEDPEVHLHPLASRTVWSLLDPLTAQKILTTNSPDLLSAAPLSHVRRMVRGGDGVVSMFGPKAGQFDSHTLRRAAYHVRIRRSSALFMRAWLLVEGESEFWLLNEVARVCGYDLASEGVTCVEFAQSGLGVQVTLAASLGIAWHILCDGDRAGHQYREEAERFMHLGGGRVFQLREIDLENCLWKHGYENIYRREAGDLRKHHGRAGRKMIIKHAIRGASKPHLALVVAEEMRKRGEKGAPPPLRNLVENVVQAARKLDHLGI
jgi:putative ATP-dependent endonuclease of the OLD family